MFCNLCGRDYARLNKIEVEGAIVDACDKCAGFGKVFTVTEYREMHVGMANVDDDFAENYGEMIKRYRESHSVTQEEFATRLSEKVSVIKRLEEETMHPDDKLVKKVQEMIGVDMRHNQSYAKSIRKHVIKV